MVNKIDYINIAKALGIILVVAGHCLDKDITNFIYLFHMPMFFMISGYLYRNKDVDIFGYCKKKIKSIYIPFIKWNIIFLILHNVFFDIGFYKEGVLNLHRIDGIGFIEDLFSILFLTHMEQVTAPSWYLRVFFVTSILYMLAHRYIASRKCLFYISILIYVCVYILFYIGEIKGSIMIYITLIMIAFVFMTWGEFYKKIELKINYNLKYNILAFLMLVILSRYGHINIVSIEFENPFFLMITSFVGTYFILGISTILVRSRLKKSLIYIGNHTCIILLLHCAAFKLINVLYSIIYNKDGLYYIANASSLIWGVIYISAGIMIPLIIENIINKIWKGIGSLYD